MSESVVIIIPIGAIVSVTTLVVILVIKCCKNGCSCCPRSRSDTITVPYNEYMNENQTEEYIHQNPPEFNTFPNSVETKEQEQYEPICYEQIKSAEHT